jgi:hypothetical protein
MLDNDRKQKMISLRLSEMEYEVLKTHYRTYGVRNVSELARLALQRIVAGSVDPQDDLATRLSALHERVHQLESQVALLMERERELV